MDETTLDLKDIIRTLRKRFRLIIYTFLAMVISALVISFLIPPTYEAETTLRIKQPKGLASSLLSDLPIGSPMASKQLMSTYAEILKSRTVVQAVIDKTQNDKEKIPRYDDFLKLITTQSVKDTEILKIKFQAQSPEEAKTVANTLVDIFMGRMTSLVRAEQTVVREFIGARLKESQAELEKAEKMLEEYKREQKIVAPAEETRAIVERLSSVSKLAAENTVAAATAQAKLASADSQLDSQKPGMIADNLIVQQYKAKLAELEIELVGLEKNFTQKHPKVAAVKASIDEVKAKLNAEITRIVTAEAPSSNPIRQILLQAKIQAEVESAAAAAQKEALKQVIAAGEQELAKLPAKEQGLVRVMRDATVAQEIYVMLAKRHEEARISEVMQPTEVQVIDLAIAPDKPIKPKKALNVIIAAILGLFTGTALAFLLEYMNKTIRSQEDVRYYLDVPVLGSIPAFDSEDGTPQSGLWSRIKALLSGKTAGNRHLYK